MTGTAVHLRLYRAPLFRAHPGGSPYNAALALARQGMDAGFATPISTDSYGQLLVNRLAEMGGHYAYPERVSNPTSLAVVTLNAGQAGYQFYRTDVADRAVDFDALRALPLPRWVQIGGLAIAPADDGQAWLDHITWMVGQGVKLSFDPNIRPAFIDIRPATAPCAMRWWPWPVSLNYRMRMRPICTAQTTPARNCWPGGRAWWP